MDRRTFFSTLATSALVAITPHVGAEVRSVRFHVAGVRFHADAALQRTGSRLWVQTEFQSGEPALRLVSESGDQIGFVPRRMVPAVNGRATEVRVIEARPHALPWKRYLVEARVAG